MSCTNTDLQNVQNALPVLRQIDELYNTANILNQQAQYFEMKTRKDTQLKRWRYERKKRLLPLIPFCGTFYSVALALSSASYLIAFLIVAGYLFLRFSPGMEPLRGKIKTIFGLRDEEFADEVFANPYDAKLKDVSEQIQNTFVKNMDAICVLPRDYRYYAAAIHIEKSLANGRADSMKEALNLYETYAHEKTMEANAQLISQLNIQQVEMMEELERQADAIRFNTGVGATFSVLSFLSL